MSLTKGGAALIGLIVFVLLMSSPGNATLFIVLSCFTALLLLNIPYAFLAVRGVQVYRDHPSHVKEGADLRVNLRVVNRTRNPQILLRFFDKGPGQGKADPVQVPMLAGRGVETVSYSCRAGRRGVYRFESCQVESSSPFGLVNARRSVAAPSELVIYPLYYELMGATFPFHKSFSGFTAAPGSRPGEGASFFGLREYREGDPIRKIHWASSLRARALIVKEFEEDMHSSIVMLLDTWKESDIGGKKSNLEVAVKVAASLANYTLVNGHPTTLMYYDELSKCLRKDKAMGDLTAVLDGLARLAASSMKPADLIVSAGATIPRFSNLVAVLLSPDREAMAELLRLRSRGIEILLIIADQPAGKTGGGPRRPWMDEMLEMFEAAGIHVIVIRPEDDIQAVLSKNMRLPRRVRA